MHSFLRSYWRRHTTKAREEASKEKKWGAGHRDRRGMRGKAPQIGKGGLQEHG